MAIKIKAMNGMAALKKAGVYQALIDCLIEDGVKVDLSAQGFFFTYHDGTQFQKAFANFPLNKTQALMLETLPSHELAMLKARLTDIITKIAAKSAPMKLGEFEVPELPKSVLKMLPPVSTDKQDKPPAPTETKKWPEFPPALMQAAPLVKLRDATKMYQPVQGSSVGSRYFLVAGRDDLRVAARYTGVKLSIRVEGSNVTGASKNLSATGFDLHDGYASVHLAIHGKDLARKTLGALLLGLGIPFETPLPDFNRIA